MLEIGKAALKIVALILILMCKVINLNISLPRHPVFRFTIVLALARGEAHYNAFMVRLALLACIRSGVCVAQERTDYQHEWLVCSFLLVLSAVSTFT